MSHETSAKADSMADAEIQIKKYLALCEGRYPMTTGDAIVALLGDNWEDKAGELENDMLQLMASFTAPEARALINVDDIGKKLLDFYYFFNNIRCPYAKAQIDLAVIENNHSFCGADFLVKEYRLLNERRMAELAKTPKVASATNFI